MMTQAGEMGILQVHLSGGEPTARKDLEQIVEAAAKAGLYTNLITAAVTLKRQEARGLAKLGLDHVQISFQDVDEENAERISAYPKGLAKKLEVAGWVTRARPAAHHQRADPPAQHPQRAALHRACRRARRPAARDRPCPILRLGLSQPRGADPDLRADTLASIELVERARERLKGVLTIDMVVPDYYAKRPKPCMGGWGKGFMNITPAGKVLPCHAAESIKFLSFDNVKDRPLRDIWLNSDAFNAFRGTSWMKEPCRSCAFREIDFGGCRCQAMAISGDPRNTDPACALSPYHGEMVALARAEAKKPPPAFVYRNPRNAAQLLPSRKRAPLVPADKGSALQVSCPGPAFAAARTSDEPPSHASAASVGSAGTPPRQAPDRHA